MGLGYDAQIRYEDAIIDYHGLWHPVPKAIRQRPQYVRALYDYYALLALIPQIAHVHLQHSLRLAKRCIWLFVASALSDSVAGCFEKLLSCRCSLYRGLHIKG